MKLVTIKVAEVFFDGPGLTRRIDQANKRNLGRLGSRVRRAARSSMRRRKRSALRGQPPSVDQGDLLKIFYSFDPSTGSVVIAPLVYDSKNVPLLLELGGRVTRKIKGHRVSQRYAPHPYMAPALKRVARQSNIDRDWRDSV